MNDDAASSHSERNEVRIFNTALALPSPAERAAYLDQACAGDAALRRQVEALLRAHADAGDFFDTDAAPNAGPPATVALPVTEQPGDRIDRYKLLQKIGEGGMGVVYMAEQEQPVRRQVALKIIKLGMDTRSVVARFEAERQALAMMDHPNIARVLDAGATETGRPYFVMELVRGVPITTYCDKNHLGTTARLDLFIQVCHAIQHAHQKGIIHRDIKPSNVMVTLHDGVPVPKVIDFGIAKATGQRLTEKTLFTNYATMVGTPAYMSPEQAEMSGLDIDTRTDVYALGVLLYELLTGTTPFPSEELLSKGYGEMQRIIAEVEPVRPSTRLSTMQNEERTVAARNRGMDQSALGRGFKGDLDWIVMKCLEKDRTRRYETASGLAADLKRHLGNEPILARPPSAAYRLQKAVRRNKLAFAAAAAVVLALTLGVIAATWQAVRAKKAERAQMKLREEAQMAVALEVTSRQAAVTARTLAEDNARKAKDEAEKSTQAAKFIQSILSGMDEAAAQGQSQTLLFELLMRALRRAETELTNQVEVQIEVISAISQCTDRLGRADYAYEIANRALVLGRARFGEDATRTAELMTLAAARAARFDRMAAAESLASRALTLLRGAHGTKHPATLAALRELGNVFASTARPSEAEPLLREHLAAATGVLDADDEAHWISRISLARALGDLNRHAEAEPLLREAAAGYERTIGTTSRRSSHATHLLCENLIRQGRLAEAEAIARSLVDHLRSLQVEHYPAVQMSLQLGKILTDLGRDADAGNALQEAFDMSRRTFGSRSTVTRDAMNALDACYRKQGRVAAAEDLKRQLTERPPAPASGGAAAFLKTTLNLEAKLRTDNTDALSAVGLAAQQAWLGRTNDWRATSRRIIERLADTSHPPSIERAAKSAVFVPGADRDLIDKAGVLAHRALNLSAESLLLPYFQTTAAMVEYRRGNLAAADALLAQVKDDGSFRGVKVALFYRAMIAARQSRMEDARQFLAAGEAAMLPLPVDENAPLDSGATHDDLILWLACKEARAMIDGQP